MTLVGFIAIQRTIFGVPQAVACRALGVSESWFYKWRSRGPSPRELRRRRLDEAVKDSFDASGGTYGSPRVLADLRDDGWETPARRWRRRCAVRVWPPDPRRSRARG